MSILEIPLTFAFVQNVLLIQYLGLYPVVSSLTSVRRAFSISAGITVSIVVAAVISYSLRILLTRVFDLPYLLLLTFTGTIAVTVFLLYMLVMSIYRERARGFEHYCLLVTMNATVFGSVLLFDAMQYNFWESITAAFFSGVGLCLAMVLIASIREKTEIEGGPFVGRNGADVLIIAGLVALAMLPVDKIFVYKLIGYGAAG